MDAILLAPALPLPLDISAATLDDRWVNWVQQGRTRDRRVRQRWLNLTSAALVALLLAGALVLGLA